MDNQHGSVVDTILTTIVALLAFAIAWGLIEGSLSAVVPAIAIALAAAIVFLLMRRATSPDRRRAAQANETLELVSNTLPYMQQGLSVESAQGVCDLLLPASDAQAVGISDKQNILGYAGLEKEFHRVGGPVNTEFTAKVVEDGQMHLLLTPEENGYAPADKRKLRASVVAPLKVRDDVVGTLKYYYVNPRHIDETQQAIASGMAQVLSTQLSLAELDAQTELATRMELQALQAQINPHFLFNTINTIASLCRTDPDRARQLLREFAVFYRRVLENSQDLISIKQEIEQTARYLTFEKARFGDERINLSVYIEPGLESLQVPAFIIQPIVENSVGHAMRDEGTLHITIDVKQSGKDVIVSVADDGVGMPPEKVANALNKGYGSGAGIALGNVSERLKGYFGQGSGLRIESEVGVGTTVYLTFADANILQS
jgi:two-component system sensor histidine kinase LytS